ncbi:inorganic phosphate transporter [Cellulomonas hominis]|uniref:Inorganic phosphate transporter n=1 Tax=Cellulomonas hominis TaxID=156981 RepID=A0A511FDF1_9CELL|nr:inorganic phosphate transporter [Cellulomonas hominis]MBB5472562.1 PiT family inorganic phosphate transporter [Cellulomonas hominis]MBU5421883.1 inorganic phosphate transporter [Cellulomonas hominis]NKY06438.1 inorganic phosphate transporter [Cellulomonas hominis]NKY11087.1 inorganic phosphate transporter [Cellulomonas hominis]GEL46634.1 inorganic phosphate transporter [Cellulomonas hominis]
MELALVVVVVALALGFDYTNGFHDAANAIATSVSTRALTPRVALLMAAVMNFAGALLGTEVAETIATSIVDLSDASSHQALVVVLCALVGAIVWNLITWWFGLPSSSTHALIGGLVGAGLAGGLVIYGSAIVDKVVLPMIFSPLIGFGLAFLVMVGLLWIVRNASPSRTTRRFRLAQTVSAAAMALGHGLQDAQKTMGVIFMALLTVGWADPDGGIPLWVKLSAAAAISLGTYSGGWRIMRTLGRKIIELDPARGFVAESVSAVVLYVNAFALHAPVSTTHTITSAIMGVGATKRLSAVRWGVAKNIGVAWVLTIPAAAAVAALVYFLLSPFLN